MGKLFPLANCFDDLGFARAVADSSSLRRDCPARPSSPTLRSSTRPASRVLSAAIDQCKFTADPQPEWISMNDRSAIDAPRIRQVRQLEEMGVVDEQIGLIRSRRRMEGPSSSPAASATHDRTNGWSDRRIAAGDSTRDSRVSYIDIHLLRCLWQRLEP